MSRGRRRPPVPTDLVVTCEHARADVPAAWRALLPEGFVRRAGHRAVDFGALDVARRIARGLEAPLETGLVTRLLVDLNRSAHHPGVFGERLRVLPAEQRRAILARYWQPYRERVTGLVAERAVPGRSVLHLSVHSFTPRLRGRRRPTDLALLYDPARTPERALAQACLADLRRALPSLRVHANRPYQGASDGFTTHLRRRHAASRYLGLELELNQRLVLRPTAADPAVDEVVAALLAALRARLPALPGF